MEPLLLLKEATHEVRIGQNRNGSHLLNPTPQFPPTQSHRPRKDRFTALSLKMKCSKAKVVRTEDLPRGYLKIKTGLIFFSEAIGIEFCGGHFMLTKNLEAGSVDKMLSMQGPEFKSQNPCGSWRGMLTL